MGHRRSQRQGGVLTQMMTRAWPEPSLPGWKQQVSSTGQSATPKFDLLSQDLLHI